MKIKTHILIARKIHEYMDFNYGNQIKRRHFIFGNIKPDLLRKFKTLNHSIHDSMDFVLDEIERHENENHSIKNPSVHLGMINHYLSDFFCSKHYFKDDEGLIKHIKYEGKIHKVISTMDVREGLDLVYYNFANNISGTFLEVLRELEREYKKQPPSIENDIFFAICAPLIACKFLLRDSAIEPVALEQAA